MARTPRQDPDLTRRQILAIARRDVLAGGLEALSMRRIGRELGYAPGNLYRYFENREAVARALSEEATAVMGERLARALRQAPDDDALVALGMEYVRTCRAHPEDMVLAGLLRSRRSVDAPVPGHSPYRVLLGAVSAAAGRGELAVDGAHALEAVAYAIWALAEGMVALERTHLRAFDADLETANRQAFRALVRGFAAPAAGHRRGARHG